MRRSLFVWTLLAIALLFPAGAAAAQNGGTILLPVEWRFMPGDSPAYAGTGLDDSAWAPIRVDRIWEQQGHEKLDGFAWFRVRFFLPASLRNSTGLQDGVRLFLGKINNFDQSYLNGAIIGCNGQATAPGALPDESFTNADASLWNVERCYVLPVDDPRLLWDKENVIAVRVFDRSGEGGLFSGSQNIRMVGLGDYLRFDNNVRPFVFEAGGMTRKFTIANTSPVHTITGRLSIRGCDTLNGQECFHRAEDVGLPPGQSREFSCGWKTSDRPGTIRYVFEFAGSAESVDFTEEVPYVLTPRAPDAPRIDGSRVIGARPDRPLLYTIAATGLRPMTFAAKKLPAGLTLDSRTGIISGRVARKGEYRVMLEARNSRGKARRELKLVIGDRIALTPPLGWNSWNCWGLSVDEGKLLASARLFREKGLQDHGWTYINLDDGWEINGDSPQPARDPRGNILTNEKFRDMKTLGDGIHALGLKFGIYSSPGPLTCGGYTGSYRHEQNDADTFAAWGIDYLKYDWCSYEKIAPDPSLAELQAPYRLMRQALDRSGRDIVYSLCQYGMGKVWEWGADVGGNLWRTTGDITDTWESLREIGFGQVENGRYAGPGHWNDPDMLVIGWVGWGPSLHPTRLTPDEQYTHISLWCLLASPLLIGCDLERLDDFSLNLLTNDEVLALDQDPLGRQAAPAFTKGDIQVWIKELADGNKGVGIFNLGTESMSFTLDLAGAGLPRKAAARDLWRQKDLGRFQDRLQIRVPAHGVVLLKITG